MILTETQAILFLKERYPGADLRVWMTDSWDEGVQWYAQVNFTGGAATPGAVGAKNPKRAVRKLAREVKRQDRKTKREKEYTKTVKL